MAVNIHITIIELNALHTKRQNLFQELDAVIHLLMEAKHWGLRKSRKDRKSGSAGMPRPISYAVFCLKKKKRRRRRGGGRRRRRRGRRRRRTDPRHLRGG